VQWFSQDKQEIRLEWGLSAVEHLAREVDCAVIVDVISFSTCVSLAVDKGARIYPYPWKDESATEYARKIGAKRASPDRRFSDKGYSLSPSRRDRFSDRVRASCYPLHVKETSDGFRNCAFEARTLP